MEFYQQLGYLIFGSRLRRLSVYFIAEVNKVYQKEGIDFDASWFPIFYILSKQDNIALVDIASQLQTSHSAVSQLISSLDKKGYLELSRSDTDARRQLVRLSTAGKDLLQQIQSIWEAISKGMQELEANDPQIAGLLEGITAMEGTFQRQSLSDRIRSHLNVSTPTL